jgi:hypothetical protein
MRLLAEFEAGRAETNASTQLLNALRAHAYPNEWTNEGGMQK